MYERVSLDRVKRPFRLFAFMISVSFLMVACGGGEPATIKVAVLPILDALPMYVADEKGYFEDANLVVEFVGVSSAAERDQVIQAGQADAMINDLVSTLFYNKDETQIVIVRYARIATPEHPQFSILAAGDSGISSLDDLKGQDIGISEGTVIEYTTERLLEAEGFSPADISTIAVPRIPDRLGLLNSGELPAANLPEPLASLAVQSGAKVILDDSTHPEFGHSMISFRKEYADENEDAIKDFLDALEKAIEDINQDKDQFSSLLSDRQLVPAPILGSYAIPDFPTASVPSVEQWSDTLAWANAKGLIEGDLEYELSVDDSFLP